MIPLVLAGFEAALSSTARAAAAVADAATSVGISSETHLTGAMSTHVGSHRNKKRRAFRYDRSTEELAAILQRNLANIRIIAGYSAEFFANHMQITKQAISHLENGRVKMNFSMFMAWSYIIQLIASRRRDNKPFQRISYLFLYKLNDYSDEEVWRFEKIIDKMAKAKRMGVDDETLELIAANLPKMPANVFSSLMTSIDIDEP